jgi:hypothetical protein
VLPYCWRLVLMVRLSPGLPVTGVEFAAAEPGQSMEFSATPLTPQVATFAVRGIPSLLLYSLCDVFNILHPAPAPSSCSLSSALSTCRLPCRPTSP